jgi:hypothetical protein
VRGVVLTLAVAALLATTTGSAHAAPPIPCGGDAGDCAENQYCAIADGGAILDGGPGSCAPEPCVVSSDCPNGGICDTSQNPFACVGCISGSDCTGVLVCDVTTHTCVPPVDAGTDAGGLDGSAEAGGDAGEPDAAEPVDAAPGDAGADASDAGSVPVVVDAGSPGQDNGTLAGGACDCDVVRPSDAAPAVLGAPFAIALLVIGRRRGRARRR